MDRMLHEKSADHVHSKTDTMIPLRGNNAYLCTLKGYREIIYTKE